MEAIAQITEWLTNNDDYNIGVKLYAKYGFSRILKNLFSKGPNAYNSEKLKSELQNILQRLQKEQDKTVRTKIIQKEIIINSNFQDSYTEKQDISHVKRYSEIKVPGYNFNELPDQLRYEWQIRIKLLNEANAHHYRLDSLTDKEVIRNSINIILENWDKIQKYWERLDYWGKYKIILPEEIKATPKKELTDPFEIIKRRNNLRSFLTKGRKRIQLLKDNIKIADLQQKIAHWEIEKNDLDKKLMSNE